MYFRIQSKNRPLKLDSIIAEELGLPAEIENCSNETLRNAVESIGDSRNFIGLLECYIGAFDRDPKMEASLGKQERERLRSLRRAIGLLSEGDRKLVEKDLPAARRCYTQALFHYPWYVYARLNLGYVHRELGALELSRATYVEGIRLAPRNPLLWSNLGRTQLLLKQNAEAEQSYFKALELFGNSDTHCIAQLERLGALVRLYRGPDQLKDPIWVTRAQYIDILERAAHDAASPSKFLAAIESFIRDGWEKHMPPTWREGRLRFFPDEAAWSADVYLYDGLAHRIEDNHSAALAVWSRGAVRFPDAAILWTNLAKVVSGPEILNYLLKALDLGDARSDNCVLIYKEVTASRGEENAFAFLLELAEKHRYMALVNVAATMKYGWQTDGYFRLSLDWVDRMRDSAAESGKLAGGLAEAGRPQEALMLLNKLVNEGVPIVGVYWNWAMLQKKIGRGEHGLTKLNAILEEAWLEPGEKAWLLRNLEGWDRVK